MNLSFLSRQVFDFWTLERTVYESFFSSSIGVRFLNIRATNLSFLSRQVFDFWTLERTVYESFFSSSTGVRFLNIRANSLRILRIGHLTVKSDKVILNNIKKPSCVDYNYKEQMVYWINAEKTKIQRIKIGGPTTKPEDVIRFSPDSRPTKLAVDWVGGNLFWSEGGQSSRRGRIMVAKADGKEYYSRPVISRNIRKPRDIALDSSKG